MGQKSGYFIKRYIMNEKIEEKILNENLKIENKCKAVIPLLMLRYRAFVEYFIEEPTNVILYKNEKNVELDKIFSIKIDKPNSYLTFYSIYKSENNDNKTNYFFLRKVIWNKKEDIKKAFKREN